MRQAKPQTIRELYDALVGRLYKLETKVDTLTERVDTLIVAVVKLGGIVERVEQRLLARGERTYRASSPSGAVARLTVAAIKPKTRE